MFIGSTKSLVTGADGGPWLPVGGELVLGDGSPDPIPESLLTVYLLGMSSDSCWVN